jgi:erythronate-4-phosphate dehydrogenase
MLNILADQNIPLASELFTPFGNVTLVDGRSLGAAQVQGADVLLVRSVTRVDECLLSGSKVQFVGSATAGYDHLDLTYLQGSKIPYALASGANAESVVEYVLAAICSQPSFLEKLFAGGKLGVVGYGHVGRRLVEVATCLGMNVGVYDPYVDSGAYTNDLQQVLNSDVISLHCELTDHGRFPSKHLLSKSRLDTLGNHQLLINAARGGVIDNVALLDRLQQPNAPVVVLDCWENEPSIHQQLVPVVTIATPHIAGYSYDGKVRGSVMLRDALARHLACQTSDVLLANDLCLNLDSSLSLAMSVSNLVTNIYRIESDDARFRSALADADSESGGRWFDDLRRNYPTRRELLGARLFADARTDSLDQLAQCFKLQLIDRSS